MKKLFYVVAAIASITGGEWMARVLFHITGPDEITTACAMLIAFAITAAYRLAVIRPSEKAAIRMARYEGRRNEKFARIEADNFMLRYEIYREDIGRRDS